MSEPSTSAGAEVNEEYKIIKSQRGGDQLLSNGYRYSKKRVNRNGHTVWHCVYWKNCKATAYTSMDTIIKQEGHVCESNEIGNDVKVRVEKCLLKAQQETTPIPSIYAEVVEEFNDAGYNMVSEMPSYNTLKKVMYRHRNKALQATKTRFFRVEDVEVPGVFQSFLVADFSENSTRILVFASPKGMAALENADQVFLDGTFKCVSPPFTQLYTIHVDLGSTPGANSNCIVPAVYALLPNKQQKTYEILLWLLKSRVPSFEPSVFTLDYEASAMLAVGRVFPYAIVQGCYFHFSRCLWRKAEQTGLKKFRSHIKRCTALAHLPLEFVADGWSYVKGESPAHENIAKFNAYFEQNWLNQSSYLYDKWCFHDIGHKTNNSVEAWNARLNKSLNPKPNLAALLKTLQKDSNYYFGLFQRQGYISQKKVATLFSQQKIKSNIEELTNQTISVGHCIEKLCNL